MLKNINVTGIILGIAVSQIAGMILGILLIAFVIFAYGNSFIVAFFEYPNVIAMTMFAGLMATACGGYMTLSGNSASYLNAAAYGCVTLVLNLGFLYLIDFRYAIGHEWMLIGTGILMVPSALSGAFISQRMKSHTLSAKQ